MEALVEGHEDEGAHRGTDRQKEGLEEQGWRDEWSWLD